MIDKKKVQRINKTTHKIKNIALYTLLVFLLLFRLYWLIQLEQSLSNEERKLAELTPAGSATIIEFFQKDESFQGPDYYYAEVEIYNGKERYEYAVVRAYNDYIGKQILVKCLPGGECVRNSIVISYRIFIIFKRNALVLAVFFLYFMYRLWLKRREDIY